MKALLEVVCLLVKVVAGAVAVLALILVALAGKPVTENVPAKRTTAGDVAAAELSMNLRARGMACTDASSPILTDSVIVKAADDASAKVMTLQEAYDATSTGKATVHAYCR